MAKRLRTLQEFANLYGLILDITEVSYGWCARFLDVEVKEHRTLSGTYGVGKTKTEALRDYARRISGQYLVYHAYRKDRKEFWADKSFAAK